jgi:hypothetical protein
MPGLSNDPARASISILKGYLFFLKILNECLLSTQSERSENP